jgi:ABC-2 type transport system permease protein
MNRGELTGHVGWAVLGCAVVVGIFAPLAVSSYSRKA